MPLPLSELRELRRSLDLALFTLESQLRLLRTEYNVLVQTEPSLNSLRPELQMPIPQGNVQMKQVGSLNVSSTNRGAAASRPERLRCACARATTRLARGESVARHSDFVSLSFDELGSGETAGAVRTWRTLRACVSGPCTPQVQEHTAWSAAQKCRRATEVATRGHVRAALASLLRSDVTSVTPTALQMTVGHRLGNPVASGDIVANLISFASGRRVGIPQTVDGHVLREAWCAVPDMDGGTVSRMMRETVSPPMLSELRYARGWNTSMRRRLLREVERAASGQTVPSKVQWRQISLNLFDRADAVINCQVQYSRLVALDAAMPRKRRSPKADS
eukprot:CAMPEP_0174832570 /NCGR_PEP_ID=MMETSP1114-20130205/3744_1 /TAXON_ID=312471 /ORGANISM="Neobodo designis, Strain CCAP 1951/1" /LENGTH=333 /DNA_ID=CAMNT_0016066431 /DNA_START=32 /DNA_END=1033 /DNA_ORIENTATION=+